MLESARAEEVAVVSLGGFVLDRRIGRGGMADVWLGHHRLDDLPAAIKVITRTMADDPAYREGLHREVRAVAGLDHPNIVPVFDAGEVDAAAAAAGGLSEGSPWLAMLYAERGDLRRLPHPMSWPLLREVLLQILDGLAHAHARGVVHRDLKPENVLLHIEQERLRLMLTDFGIAHVVDAGQTDGGASANSAGTPHYMAPEQFMGRWRDYGPWTDLYALGCMAFELATGQPPFTDRNLFGIAQKHLTAPIPPLRCAEPMPAGFEAWIRRMMGRDPHARYRSAADAAWALGRLAVPDAQTTRAARLDALERLGAGRAGAVTEISDPMGVALAETHAVQPGYTLASVVRPDVVDRPAGPARATDPDLETPPMPETSFVDAPERPLLKGVGLGLFGLRRLPFVDRDHQRDLLWRALRDVRANGHGRLVVLEGLEGSGKSRLAQWFARRASEVGAAEPIHVRHSPMDAPGDAIAAAVEGWFRGAGLDRSALERRIAHRLTTLDPDRAETIAEVDAPALARLLRPRGDERLQALVMTPRERYRAVHAWWHALGRRRPIVLVLDDVQWCSDTLHLVESLLTSPCPLPVLAVATLRSDQCCPGSAEGDILTRLRAMPRVESSTVGPLSDDDHRRVIGDLLGLHPMLTDQLLLRAEGNPLFAHQIIADWVERDALVGTAEGYTCNGTALVDVPPDLPTLAGRRFDRLAARFPRPDAVHTALLVAAVLGHAVRSGEWQAAFARLADPGHEALPEGLQAALFDAGLAVPDRDGWIFGHVFARDALLERARTSGRWSALHRACAEVVRGGRAPDERRARHLMVAGDHAVAVDALLEAARSRMDASEYGRALRLCDWRARAIDHMALPEDDVRRVAALPVRVEALRFTGRFQESDAALERFLRFRFGPEHPYLLAEAERLRGGQELVAGRVEAMAQSYRAAVDLYRAAGDVRGEARARHGWGWSLLFFGRLEAAERAFAASHAVARRAGLRIDEAWALHGIGTARMFGERPEARASLEAAQAIFVEVRLPVGMLGCRLFLSEVERQAGDLEAAWRLARSAFELGAAIDSQLRFLARSVVAMLEMDRGHVERARHILDDMRASGDFDRIQRQYGPSVQTAVARIALVDGELDRVAAVADGIEAVRHRAFLHPRSRQALVGIAEALESRGERMEAARWWGFAADYHERLDPERSAEYTARARMARSR